MKTSIWYNSKAGQWPKQRGYYIAFVGITMAGGESGIRLCWFDGVDTHRANWYEGSTANSPWASVVFWTDADPYRWYEETPNLAAVKMTAAEQDAWAAVELAIAKYETVRALCL